MKVIIDIDEELYKNVIEDTRNGYLGSDVWKAVANGTPISTEGDLISRNDLKKVFDNLGYLTVKIERIIDNAPTVDAIVHTIEVRTQAEWVEKHCDYGVYYRCSNCHKMPPNYECDYKEGAIKTNYCPNCGADMRGDNNGKSSS